jgi:hypothetical protein
MSSLRQRTRSTPRSSDTARQPASLLIARALPLYEGGGMYSTNVAGGCGARRTLAAPHSYRCLGFSTRPALMHDVHTSIRRVVPSTTARTRWMFGFHRRRVRDLTRRLMALVPSRWTALPKLGCFPQISQTDPTVSPLDCLTVGAVRQERHALRQPPATPPSNRHEHLTEQVAGDGRAPPGRRPTNFSTVLVAAVFTVRAAGHRLFCRPSWEFWLCTCRQIS